MTPKSDDRERVSDETEVHTPSDLASFLLLVGECCGEESHRGEEMLDPAWQSLHDIVPFAVTRG